eukprot:CAMPEP_0178489510 /NCGR_PEP_ID=MMETSP0696-20121128/10414_1 /TAXON_ID=265572 /ORGANISM="Extubocellulus spinifer, Strain CCMP396" /LENGTH=520 /DNA_ID=CAMNT_0020117315 /DNA_START=306 /DNA_END=1868 /DNA_ORIENTATION=+
MLFTTAAAAAAAAGGLLLLLAAHTLPTASAILSHYDSCADFFLEDEANPFLLSRCARVLLVEGRHGRPIVDSVPNAVGEDVLAELRSSVSKAQVFRTRQGQLAQRYVSHVDVDSDLVARLRGEAGYLPVVSSADDDGRHVLPTITVEGSSVPHVDCWMSPTTQQAEDLLGGDSERTALIWMDTIDGGYFRHGDVSLPIVAGTLVHFRGDIPHHTVLPRGRTVSLLGPFDLSSPAGPVFPRDIGPSNQLPVANDDAVTTPEDTPVVIDVLANDEDNGFGAISVFDVSPTPQTIGDVAINNGFKTITYTPNPGFCDGTDTFEYVIIAESRGGVAIDSATVTVTVTCICGDGQIDGNEQCEDGNTEDGDGCSSTCRFEEQPCMTSEGEEGFVYTITDTNPSTNETTCLHVCDVKGGKGKASRSGSRSHSHSGGSRRLWSKGTGGSHSGSGSGSSGSCSSSSGSFTYELGCGSTGTTCSNAASFCNACNFNCGAGNSCESEESLPQGICEDLSEAPSGKPSSPR